jgi:hypothetical protein
LKILVNKSGTSAFSFNNGSEQVTLGAGKKVKVRDCNLDAVRKQIECFDFLEIQELEEEQKSVPKVETVVEEKLEIKTETVGEVVGEIGKRGTKKASNRKG